MTPMRSASRRSMFAPLARSVLQLDRVPQGMSVALPCGLGAGLPAAAALPWLAAVALPPVPARGHRSSSLVLHIGVGIMIVLVTDFFFKLGDRVVIGFDTDFVAEFSSGGDWADILREGQRQRIGDIGRRQPAFFHVFFTLKLDGVLDIKAVLHVG